MRLSVEKETHTMADPYYQIIGEIPIPPTKPPTTPTPSVNSTELRTENYDNTDRSQGRTKTPYLPPSLTNPTQVRKLHMFPLLLLNQRVEEAEVEAEAKGKEVEEVEEEGIDLKVPLPARHVEGRTPTTGPRIVEH